MTFETVAIKGVCYYRCPDCRAIKSITGPINGPSGKRVFFCDLIQEGCGHTFTTDEDNTDIVEPGGAVA